MPTRSPTSPASNADRVSPSDNEALISSSPPRESSHDEYSPERPSISISVTTQFTSPPNHSNTMSNLPADIRNEIHALYTKIYGEGSQWCLVTQSKRSLIVAHVVQHASRHDQVRYLSSICHVLPTHLSPVNHLQVLSRARMVHVSCRQQEESFVSCVIHFGSTTRMLMLIPTGTLHLMLVNLFYSQMLLLWQKSIAMSNRLLPRGKIHLRIMSNILPPR